MRGGPGTRISAEDQAVEVVVDDLVELTEVAGSAAEVEVDAGGFAFDVVADEPGAFAVAGFDDGVEVEQHPAVLDVGVGGFLTRHDGLRALFLRGLDGAADEARG